MRDQDRFVAVAISAVAIAFLFTEAPRVGGVLLLAAVLFLLLQGGAKTARDISTVFAQAEPQPILDWNQQSVVMA